MAMIKLNSLAGVLMVAGSAATGAVWPSCRAGAADEIRAGKSPVPELGAKASDEPKGAAAQEKTERDIESDRAASKDNLHRIGLAMHAYHERYKHFPTAAIYGKDNQPILSWRVAILPYLGEEELYRQFRLDEAWDSDHNKKLLVKMPRVYAPPGIKTIEPNTTFYQVFAGDGSVFDGHRKVTFRDITDGTSCTVLVVEAGEAVPWTKPQDLPFGPRKELPKLGGIFEQGFHFLAADGAVHDAKKGPDPKKMRAAISRASGQIKDLNDLEP